MSATGRAMTAPTPRQPLLDVAGLRVTYGGVVAVSDVDLQIAEGTIYGLIGPNGAGKTSMVDALTGYIRPAAGRITFGFAAVGNVFFGFGWPGLRVWLLTSDDYLLEDGPMPTQLEWLEGRCAEG